MRRRPVPRRFRPSPIRPAVVVPSAAPATTTRTTVATAVMISVVVIVATVIVFVSRPLPVVDGTGTAGATAGATGTTGATGEKGGTGTAGTAGTAAPISFRDILVKPYVEMVISVSVFAALALLFLLYMLSSGIDVRRVSPYLGIGGLFVGAGAFIRVYPSDWSNAVSTVFIAIGYLLVVFLVAKELNYLPGATAREKKEIEEYETGLEAFAVHPLEQETLNRLKQDNKVAAKNLEDMMNQSIVLEKKLNLARVAGKEKVVKDLMAKYKKQMTERRDFVTENVKQSD